MNIFELLNAWDTKLFLLINGFHSSSFDGIMFLMSDTIIWIPLYLSVLFIAFKHWKKEGVWVALALILCCVIADQVASGVIKDLVKRPRPSHAEHLKGLIHFVNDYKGGRYGFVSSHAANTIGFALLTSLLFQKKVYTYLIISWAVVVAYSRIYLGVHYPLDILGGEVVGVLAALFCFWIIRKFRPQIIQQRQNADSVQTLPSVLILSITVLGIIVYGFIAA